MNKILQQSLRYDKGLFDPLSEGAEKPTRVVLRSEAKYPWMIKQGQTEVKLSWEQMRQLADIFENGKYHEHRIPNSELD